MRIFQNCQDAICVGAKLLQSGKASEPSLWLPTDHRWPPTRRMAAKTRDCRSPNSLALSAGSVGGALVPRLLQKHCQKRRPSVQTDLDAKRATHRFGEWLGCGGMFATHSLKKNR